MTSAKWIRRWKPSWRHCCVGFGLVLCLGMLGCAPPSPTGTQNTTPDDTASESTPSEASPEASNSLSPVQGQMLPITAEVDLGGQIIGLEVAQSRQEQTIGLMNREILADDRGMLFPFSPPETVNFWMKNVLIPLDMVFVYQGEVVAIAPDVPPCIADPCPTYGPEEQLVDYVIELRGGRAEDLGVQIGDPVAIQWLETSQ